MFFSLLSNSSDFIHESHIKECGRTSKMTFTKYANHQCYSLDYTVYFPIKSDIGYQINYSLS